jgi:hypothetical protein
MQIATDVQRTPNQQSTGSLVRVQRMPFIAAEAPLARLTNVYRLKEVEDEEADDELKLPSTLTKIDEVRVTLEDLDDYFRRKLGNSGAPLAYVTRDDPGFPVKDPGFGLPTFAEEMIARAPHTGAVYQRDNNAVWNVIRHVTHGGPAWNWVSAHNRGGRGSHGGGRHSNLTDRYYKPDEWKSYLMRSVRLFETSVQNVISETSSTPAPAPALTAANVSSGVTSR